MERGQVSQALMAALGIISRADGFNREDALRLLAALLTAAALHLLFFRLLMFKTPIPFEIKEDFVAVELVTLPPKPRTIEPVEVPPEIEAAPAPPPPPSRIKPKPQAASPPAPSITAEMPDILSSSRRATLEDRGNTVPLSKAMTPSSTVNEPSADDKRIDEGLKSLAAELTCLNGFSTDCADIRKEVFKDFQMTETDKVYTKKYAHTGMPAEFYGMSERQIRAKLNVPNAGENGIYIPFTNIGIDGGWLDAMHGVNKGCEWKVAIDKAGNHGPIKDCPDYLPAAKEDRDRRNKFQARLKSNEARRKDEVQP